MSAAIQESIQKGMQNDQRLRQMGIPLSRDSLSHYGHLDFLYTIPPKTSFSPTAVSTPSIIDFEIKNSPGFHLKDNRSLILAIQIAEVGGTNAVTLNPIEALFDKNNAVEFLCDGQSLGTPLPMLQLLLEPAIEMSDVEYGQICSVLNHNTSWASPTAITNGTSVWYFLRISNPFPKDGMWLGALNDHVWTIRLRTQNCISSGTGVPNLLSLNLLMETVTVPDSEYAELRKEYANKVWTASIGQLFESPNQITLVSSGESPRTQLQSFKDLSITSIYFFLHASRSFTSSAYFAGQTLQNGAQVYIIDRNGMQLFTSNGEPYGYSRTYKATRMLADSKVFANINGLVLVSPAPDQQAKIHLSNDVSPKFVASGDEQCVIKDSGSTNSVYLDGIAFYDATFVLQSGAIQRVSQ
jgi:hypothetical protein